MKKLYLLFATFGVLFLLQAHTAFGQSLKEIETALRDKYGSVYYHDSYGGWFSVFHFSSKGGADKYGICDIHGKEVIPPRYDQAYKSENYYEVKLNGKVAIIDLNGKELLPFKYDKVEWFQIKDYGYAEVEIEGKKGVIDKNGKEFLACLYDDVQVYEIAENKESEVKKEGKVGMIDNTGKLIIPCKYDYISTFMFSDTDYNGIAVITDGLSGKLDKQGVEVLPCIYSYIGTVYNSENNRYVLVKGGNVYYEKGREYSYGSQYPTGDSKMALYDWGNKKTLTDFKYSYIENTLREGLIRFNIGGKITRVDNYNYKPVVEGGKWGYMDENGKEVIPAKYESATVFNEGVAQVVENGVNSFLENPLTGSKVQMANGAGGNSVDRNIPQTSKQEEETFAFIIANENYKELKGADFAINDGKVFAEYCKKTLGVPDRNVHYYEDATFGNWAKMLKRMSDIADVYDGSVKLIVYFAGLGTSDPSTKEKYLLPTDASMSSLGSTGCSVSKFINEIGNMNTAYTLVVIDAPFAGTDRSGKMLSSNRGVKIASKQASVKGNTILCIASDGQGNAYAGKQYAHGLLTFAILEKLQSSKAACAIKEVFDAAIDKVRKESLKTFESVQTPTIKVSEQLTNKWNGLKF